MPYAGSSMVGTWTRSAPWLYRRGVLVLLLIRWGALAGAFAVTAWLLPGMDVSGGVWAYIWVSALFGIVNAIIGTFLRILTLPLTVVTLGLFSIVVNALLLEITDGLTSHLSIDEFWWTAIWGAITISVVAVILEIVVRTTLAPTARTSEVV
jgi:putative membrane protein